jgi:hypothetical protein
MATRMQQRRGTAAQWTAANPTLAAGEIGFETDTNKFKMGNGSSNWAALTYFSNNAALTDLLDGAPDALNTLNELAAAIGDDPAFFTTVGTNLTNHQNDTTDIHGITNTADLETISGAQTKADTAVSTHSSATTSIHGIEDTALLATIAYVTDAVDGVTDDYSNLAGTGLTWNSGLAQFDIDDTVATETYADGAVTTHNTETTSVHGIADTAALATTTNVSTAQTAAESFATGAVSTHSEDTTNIHGIADTSILVTTTGTQTLTNKTITSPLGIAKADVGLGDVDNTADADKPVSTAQATAIETAKTEAIADATAQVTAVLDGAPGALDTLNELAAALGDDADFAGTLTTNLGLKVDSLTPISQKTDSYTLSSLTERDDLIEMGKATAQTLTIPLNATVAFPVGTSLDILQTGAGQVTIAGAEGVTVNATPGLKLRTQWSSATLFKRAENTWVVYGDLTA